MAYTGNSIVDYLKSQGQDYSYSARKKLAEEMGITNYTGSAAQNTSLLNSLRSGGATASGETTAPSGSSVIPVGVTRNDAPKAAQSVDANANATTEETTTEPKVNKLDGVDDETLARLDEKFVESDALKGASQVTADALHKVNKLTSTDSIISDSTRDAMNSSFTVPGAVKQADIYLSEQLSKIQSGKTSYSDQLQEMMDKIGPSVANTEQDMEFGCRYLTETVKSRKESDNITVAVIKTV